MKWFGRRDAEEQKIVALSSAAEDLREELVHKEEHLKQLFVSLKTDLINDFLRPGRGRIKPSELDVLYEQVRGVLSIARTLDYKELEEAFSQEEHNLKEISAIVERGSGVSAANSPELRAALERMREAFYLQQRLLFNHDSILLEEKERVVNILQQANALKTRHETDKHLATPEEAQDNRPEYI